MSEGLCGCGHPAAMHVSVADDSDTVVDRYCTAPNCDSECSMPIEPSLAVPPCQHSYASSGVLMPEGYFKITGPPKCQKCGHVAGVPDDTPAVPPVGEATHHDNLCEAELTSHGYTPCRCDERVTPPAAVFSGGE
jgi:hypothetical protein